MNWKKALLDAFTKSYIISGLLALSIWGCIIALAWSGRGNPDAAIPEVLVAGGMAIVGFFFGSKFGQTAEKIRSSSKNKDHDDT